MSMNEARKLEKEIESLIKQQEEIVLKLKIKELETRADVLYARAQLMRFQLDKKEK